MSVVDNFKRKELVDYYHKWYHPDHQGLIIVGNVDVDKVEAQIKKLFGDIKNPENEAPIVDEQVPDNAEPIVVIDKDKEEQSSSVEVMFKHDVFPDSLKNTINYLIYDYVNDAIAIRERHGLRWKLHLCKDKERFLYRCFSKGYE